MLNYNEKCQLDQEYAKVIAQVNDVYVELLKVNPDDYSNDAKVTELINKVRETVDFNQANNAVEADDSETSLDDNYQVAEVIDEMKKAIEAYEGLTDKLQETADCILEKGYLTDLVEALAPYAK